MSRRPPLVELVDLFGGAIAKVGITTAPGAPAGNSFIDASLIGLWGDSYLNMLTVLYPGEPDKVDSARNTIFNNGTGEMTLEHAYKNAGVAIPAGVSYAILSFPFATSVSVSGLAALLIAIKAETDKLISVVTTGVYAHSNDLLEHDAIVFPALYKDIAIRFDVNNLAQVTTIREYEQVDGANYRELSASVFPADFDAGAKAVSYTFKQANSLYKITFQSSIVEGGVKNVPYRLIMRDLS